MTFKFNMILVFLVLQVAIVVSRCDEGLSPPERYWKAVLPNSPMPQAVKNILPTPTGHTHGGTSFNGGHGVGIHIHAAASDKPNRGYKDANRGYKAGYAAANNRANRGYKSGYAAANDRDNRGYKSGYAVANGEIERYFGDNPNAFLFFLEKDMQAGRKMKLDFVKSSNQATFLPRQVAASIPFSSKRFPENLRKFKPTSDEAEIMKDTIKECEDEAGLLKGEEKFCATSLESMIDSSISMLGSRNVEAISTNYAQENGENSSTKEYTLVGEPRNMPGNTALVACHKMDYAYAVFYCHKIPETVAYKVSLAAADGSKVEAVAVCHHDTSQWNPEHMAFQVLKVQPGVPVCHFLTQEQIVWVPKYN